MLSRRNFAMMMTMILVVLVLFLSSVVLKEYFNDYDVNHAAAAEPASRLDTAAAAGEVLFFGTPGSGYDSAVQEWAGYRKMTVRQYDSAEALSTLAPPREGQPVCLLIDGELLETDVEQTAAQLVRYVEQGGVAVFCRLPSYEAIRDSETLRQLLGIQQVRAPSVRLHEIRLYSGFLLGGETCYSFEDRLEPELADLQREVPWYDISARTKSYMVGFLSAAEKSAQNLNNEDMPAILWRSSLGTGSVFAVNGDYMLGTSFSGLLDAMLYEASDYALYPVVNAQSLLLTGFPDLTEENREALEAVYGMTAQQLCRDILWPSFVAAAQKGDWKLTAFLSVRQQAQSAGEPNREDLIDYLKYFNETAAEAGVTLGRLGSDDLLGDLQDESDTLQGWGLRYAFTGGYVRGERLSAVIALLDGWGELTPFPALRTVVAEYGAGQPVLAWLAGDVTLQSATADVYVYSDRDSLRLKCVETSLGYSSIQADLYRVLWPEEEGDHWEKLAEKLAAHIDTYWKPFAAFEKTTITQSDSRVRDFLNGSAESTREGDQITIRVSGYAGPAWLLLRTHGEEPAAMAGGDWTTVERGTYLLRLDGGEASVTLRSELQPYYEE